MFEPWLLPFYTSVLLFLTPPARPFVRACVQLKLTPGELRTLMDAFERTVETNGLSVAAAAAAAAAAVAMGVRIDYTAFCEFAAYAPPELSEAAAALSRMLLEEENTAVFVRADTHGLGVVTRDAFTAVLRDLGYGHVSARALRSVADLFDLELDNQVWFSSVLSRLPSWAYPLPEIVLFRSITVRLWLMSRSNRALGC